MPSYNLTAIQCPTPLTPDFELVQGSGNPGNAPTSYSLEQGDSATILTKWNNNFLRMDMLGGYAPPPYSILYGLGLSGSSSSLVLTVSYGWANVRGPVYRSSTTTTVTASGWSTIWLNENASISCEYNSLTPPGDHCVFLGTVTAVSGITDIDYSGRWTARAGILYRRTADTGFPTDSPGMPVLTETAYGTYYWDGTEHRQHNDADAMYFTQNGMSLGKHTSFSYVSQTTSASITLAASSYNIQYITPTADLNLYLPASGSITPGMWFETWNNAASGSGFDISVYALPASTTLITTVTPQSYKVFRVRSTNGAYNWISASTPGSTGVGGGA